MNISWRTTLLWTGIGLATLVVLLGGAATWLLGTENGRLWAARTAIARSPVAVSVTELRSPALGEWSLERLEVQRDGNVWIAAQELRLRFSPWELLSGRLLVDDFAATQIDYHHLPGEKDKNASEKPFQPPSIAVRSFSVDALHLDGLTAEPLPALAFEGNVALFWESTPLRLDLDARTLPQDDRPATELSVQSTAKTTDTVQLKASLDEGPGGWLGTRLDLPLGGAVHGTMKATVSQQAAGYRLDLQNLDLALGLEQLDLPITRYAIEGQGIITTDDSFSQLRFEDLTLNTDGRRHSIDGLLSQQSLDLTVDLNRFPLSWLSPWVAQIEGGELSAQVTATGSPENPVLEGRTQLQTRYHDHPLEAEIAGRFTRQELQFNTLDATFGEAHLWAEGLLDLKGNASDIAFTAEQLPVDYLEMAGISLPEGLTGRLVSAEGHLQGDYRNPAGRIDAQVEGLYRDRPLSMALHATGNRDAVTLQDTHVALGEASLRADGSIDVAARSADLQLALSSFPVALLSLADVAVPPALSATLSGTATVQGTVAAPSIRGNLKAEGHYRGQAFSLAVRGRGDRQHVQLDAARAVVDDATLTAEGSIDLAGREADIAVSLQSAPLALLELADITLPAGLTAAVSGDATLQGPWERPQVSSTLEAEGDFHGTPLAMTAHGQLRGKRLQLDNLRLQLDGETGLRAEGYAEPQAYDLRLTASDLPSQTLNLLGWDLVTGEFDADLRLQGTPDTPQIDGELSYAAQLTQPGDEDSRTTLIWHTSLATEDQTLRVKSTVSREGQPTGTVHLSAPITRYLAHFRDGGPLSTMPVAFRADGEIDLNLLNIFINGDIHRINGLATVDLTGSGTVSRPDIEGGLSLADARYENTIHGFVLANIGLKLASDGQRLVIRQASATDGEGGHFSADGSLNWRLPDSPDAVDLHVTADNAYVLRGNRMEGQVSGELDLTGSLNELWLRGTVVVDRFAAGIDAALQESIPTIEVTEVYGDPDDDEQDPLAGSGRKGPVIHLDLTVRADQQVYLRGRGLEAELAGRLHLTGTARNPTYEGRLSTVRGEFEIFGNEFQLGDGEIIFANNAISMFIPATLDLEEHEVRVELAGTLDKLSIDFSSVPDLPEDEIISRLIFGKSAQNISPFQAVRLAAAIQKLRGGGGGFDPIGSTRDMLGVDTLSVETASTEAGTGVAVGVGKYINERVYLEVERVSNATNQPWRASVEVQLTPRLHLKSTSGTEGQAGAELIWKRDF